MISRRAFLKNTSLSSLALGTRSPLLNPHSNFFPYHPQEKGPVVTKISIFPAGGSFYRFIGPNAYDEKPKGMGRNPRKLILVELSDGTLGIGTLGYRQVTDSVVAQIKELLGRDIFSFYRWEGDTIASVSPTFQPYFWDAQYAWVESAILDAVGKLKQVPVWKLFGSSIREGIDPYDGTLYFEDIAQNTDAQIIGTIGKRIKQAGYRAVKIKLGRPDKWLPGEAGVERDIEAFIALREAVGNNFNLMADANNGYRNKIDWAVKMLKACAPYDMHFIEELIPDDLTQYRHIRDKLLEDNLFIPIADGESISREDILPVFTDYCQSGTYNFIQPDMPTCGFTNILRTAQMAESYPHVKLIPHVWQSQMGLLMSAHLSKIQRNVPFVEDSRYHEYAILANGYAFDKGQWFIPDEPGWGVQLAPGYEQFVEGAILEIM